MKYFVDLEKGGKCYTLDNQGNSKKEIMDFAKKEGYTVTKIVPASKNHRCKYCNGITDGVNDDLLCMDCREVFGHALYSEL